MWVEEVCGENINSNKNGGRVKFLKWDLHIHKLIWKFLKWVLENLELICCKVFYYFQLLQAQDSIQRYKYYLFKTIFFYKLEKSCVVLKKTF